MLNDAEKRWLEIIFYFLCHRIYLTNKSYDDIYNFFKAFHWTNQYESDTLIKTLEETNIIHNLELKPSKYELNIAMLHPKIRFKMSQYARDQLFTPFKYRITPSTAYRTAMREETLTEPTELYPKFKNKTFYDAFYSFLLVVAAFGNLFNKEIKL